MHSDIRRGTKNLLRDINNSRVLQIIQSRSPVSRAEIARLAHLPPPTITAIVNDFLRAGLVREPDLIRESDGHSSEPHAVPLGRPPILLELNERAAFTVGVKLRRNALTVAVTDLAGNVQWHADEELGDGTPEDILNEVASKAHAGVAAAGVALKHVLGIGIGMPGLIDHSGGVCRYSPQLGWRAVEVGRILEEHCSMHVYVDNDVNMLTAAQMAFGHGQGVNNLLAVTLGSGIGLGIVMGGEIYRGSFGGAGEFGHVKVGRDLACECGKAGCLEAIASEQGILRQVESAHGRPVSLAHVNELADRGDEGILAIFDRAGATLGQSIGNLVNLFKTELVIVTGEGVKTTARLLNPMRRGIETAVFGMLGEHLGIVVDALGDEAWARGAASMVVHEMLRTPIYESQNDGPLARILDRRTSGLARAS